MYRLSVLLLSLPLIVFADSPLRLFPEGKQPTDRRLTQVRTLNDKDFFLKSPGNLNSWTARRKAVREQLLVANGLWPMPTPAPLKPVIHGRIDRDGYSVEKVYFASLPGHYVTGSLYRPRTKDGKLPEQKMPGILCPHGHWRNGRFYDAGEARGKAEINSKAEKGMAGARHPLQARCAQLARMGCVVFHYDMVGYADSKALSHSAFNDVDAELYLQNLMGIQTFNSLRSLDFLTSLPEVDTKRIGVTGASGGGTQTFILCAIDDRPAVAFPAVMVSTAMQGGCVCENTSYLRVGTGNVEFAALFAPKPLAMSGANDWTLEIERKGLPELKAIYKLYGKEDHVDAKCWPKYDHNYNQHAREMMYAWFNKYLGLNQPATIEEKPFEPIPPAELSVFDKDHPQPADSANAAKIREYLTAQTKKQLDELKPTDAGKLAEYRRVIGTGLRVMAGSSLPEPREVEGRLQGKPMISDLTVKGYTIGRRGQGEQVPAVLVQGKAFNGTVVVWVHPQGKSSLLNAGKFVPEVQTLIDKGAAVLAVDVYGTGELTPEKPMKIDSRFAGYTFGYNRPLLSQRIHDILTAVGFARKQPGVKKVHLVGVEKAGPWVMLARGLCGTAVTRTAADVNGFRFDNVKSTGDEMMLPGALRYAGLGGLTGLAAPGEMLVYNHRGTGLGAWLKTAYKAAGAEKNLQTNGDKVALSKIVAWLMS